MARRKIYKHLKKVRSLDLNRPKEGGRKRLDAEGGGPGVVAFIREGLCPAVDVYRLT